MMNGETPRRRPVGVWLVSAFYLLSAGWTLLSFSLIYSGAIKINAAQEAYFASLTGMTFGGDEIKGLDSIKTVGCK